MTYLWAVFALAGTGWLALACVAVRCVAFVVRGR